MPEQTLPDGYAVELCRRECCGVEVRLTPRWSFSSDKGRACGFASEEEATAAAWIDRGRVAAGGLLGAGLGQLGRAITFFGKVAGVRPTAGTPAAPVAKACSCWERTDWPPGETRGRHHPQCPSAEGEGFPLEDAGDGP